MGCRPRTSNLELVKSSATMALPIQTPISTATRTSTPISIIELPGPPEEISKVCQVEDFKELYCPSVRGASPDGTWKFIYCMEIYDCEKPSHYVMHNSKNQDESWVVANQEVSSLWGTNPFGWHVVAWSENNHSAYIAYRKFCEHYPSCSFVDAQLVYELNMTSHLTNEILNRVDLSNNYAYAFSPDSKTIAYIITGTQKIIFRNLATNQENRIELSDSEISYGNISWSPDGNKLVMQSSLREQVWDFSLWLFDIKSQSATKILSDDDRDFFPRGWKDNDTISLFLFGAGADKPSNYIYILSAEELQLERTQKFDQQ